MTQSATKQIEQLGPVAEKRLYDYLRHRIAPLHDPRQLGKQLQTTKPDTMWRYRVGNYRILCELRDDELRVLVIKVGHRRSVYRRL